MSSWRTGRCSRSMTRCGSISAARRCASAPPSSLRPSAVPRGGMMVRRYFGRAGNPAHRTRWRHLLRLGRGEARIRSRPPPVPGVPVPRAREPEHDVQELASSLTTAALDDIDRHVVERILTSYDEFRRAWPAWRRTWDDVEGTLRLLVPGFEVVREPVTVYCAHCDELWAWWRSKARACDPSRGASSGGRQR